MSTYNEERAAEKASLVAKLRDIAEHLEGWRVEAPEDRNPYFEHETTGARIWTHVENYGANRGRIELSAGVPDSAEYSSGDYAGLDRPEITVSGERPATALAKDITRRIVGPAVEYWQAVETRIQHRLSAFNARQTLSEELARLMGGKASLWRDGWSAQLPDSLRVASGNYTYGDLTPDYNGSSVTVDIHGLSPDRARQLAALIAAWVNES